MDNQPFRVRARRALWEYAFFRLESAITLALTLVLTAYTYYERGGGMFPAWTWIVCLVVGTAGEVALLYTSLTDAETAREVITRLLRETYYPKQLRDRELQAQVDKAFDYHGRIELAIGKWRDSGLKKHLSETADQISDWLKNIYTLAQRLDLYLAEEQLFINDHNQAQRRLKELRADLQKEKDPSLRQQLEVTIAGLERQVESLESLRGTMQKARLQLEHTLSALSTIYSQTMRIDTEGVDGGSLSRVRQEISQEISGLGDILDAMGQVYGK